MNRFVKKRRSPGILALDIIVGILCVITIGAGVFAFTSFKEDWGYSFDADSFYYRLEDEDFGQMVEMYYANEAAGIDADEELKQYYGVAKYFEAASYYKAYQEAEDSEQALKYQGKMQEAQNEMGELNFLSDRICEKLEITIR